MILIEGPDHVGKTTIAKKLADMMTEDLDIVGDLPYVHMSKPSIDFDYRADYLAHYNRKPCVYDRGHLGALIYGNILGLHDTKGYNLRRAEMISNWFRQQGGMIVVVTALDSFLQKQLTENKKPEMFSDEAIEMANIFFCDLANDRDHNLVDRYVCLADFMTDDHVGDIYNSWRERWSKIHP